MDKARITRKQADSLEAAVKVDGKSSVLSSHAINNTGWCNACEDLNLMPLMTLASALINGYEVEETPEDKVRAMFKRSATDGSDSFSRGMNEGYIGGILDTLSALNIQIAGVNHD